MVSKSRASDTLLIRGEGAAAAVENEDAHVHAADLVECDLRRYSDLHHPLIPFKAGVDVIEPKDPMARRRAIRCVKDLDFDSALQYFQEEVNIAWLFEAISDVSLAAAEGLFDVMNTRVKRHFAVCLARLAYLAGPQWISRFQETIWLGSQRPESDQPQYGLSTGRWQIIAIAGRAGHWSCKCTRAPSLELGSR
jgi:hypothetical protein